MKRCPKCGELVGDNVDVCFNCRFVFSAEAVRRLEAEREAERRRAEIQKIEEVLAINDLYEYDVVTVDDKFSGSADVQKISQVLKEHGKSGWRLVSSFTNELGKNSTTISVGGMSSGTNSTMDQTVLVFERCFKRAEK